MGNEVLTNAVGQVFLFGIARHVVKWKDRNRWLLLDRRLLGLRWIALNVQVYQLRLPAIHMDGLGDILERLIPAIPEIDIDLACNLVINRR